ncbi:AAA family ATPase [Rhodobacteraceae bacterium NNCM2]|nr:AAA family ATPase [Coraliihabitans acroporae]
MVLSIDDALRILQRNLWVIVSCIAVAVAISVVALSQVTPLYTASAQLLLGEQGRSATNVSDLVTGITLNDTIVEGELAILESGRVLGRVVEKLSLDEDEEFNPNLRTPSQFDKLLGSVKSVIKSLFRKPPPKSTGSNAALDEAAQAESNLLGANGLVIGTLRNRMSVRQQGNSFVVSVSVTSQEPKKAAAITNVIMDEYINYRLETKFNSVERVSAWLDNRLKGLEAEVESSENAVLQMRGQVSSDNNTIERLDQQVTELTTRLVTARADLAETTARYDKINEIVEQQGFLGAADVLTSDAITKIREELTDLRLEETSVITRFGEDSPKLAPIRFSISALQGEIEREVRRNVQELYNTVEISRAGVQSLEEGLRNLEKLVIERSKEQVHLRQLSRVADANLLIYEDFLSRFNESREAQNLQKADAEVISYAPPPSAPSSPKIKVSVMLAVAAGLFFALGIVFLREFRRIGFTTADEVTELTGLPVWCTFSKIRMRKLSRAIPSLIPLRDRPKLVQEARNLRNYLTVGIDDHSCQTILLTSSISNEGKSTTAMMLGWAATQSGKSCLIIDADMRRPSLSSPWRKDGEPDLVSVLRKEVLIEEAVRVDADTGCDILPTNQILEDPTVLLSVDHVADLIQQARSKYDLVVIDSPPMHALSDALAFARVTDVVLFAIRWRSTPSETVMRSVRTLRTVSIGPVGAVLTFVDRRKERHYQYRGYEQSYAAYN